eukprot:CAMPEP_0114378824 /NCGR_PEP_ID=MMETSP0102-20121206/1866_1 /TAXON_ID=38822 ORGANISM="Pteridomonas danica, Strain PT" /NCGR_SAMPLE_ID=MMETSP0102 /ASSEMBLY_ACC=CAM_ASM_000212 /LENGTH=431 /DNA_ID=CAMNT_0001533753 /DNA_START=105 /DNA_END=1397 /DNA_ORIENTATION=-
MYSDNTVEIESNIDLNSTIGISGATELVINGNGYILNGKNKNLCIYIGDVYSEVTFNNLVIKNGYSEDTAGGVYVVASFASFNSCAFHHNTGLVGGGLLSYYATVNFDGCNFTANEATLVEAGGGGLGLFDSSSTITSSTFIANIGSTSGGGLFADGGGVEVASSVFERNRVTAEQSGGGGLSIHDASSIVSDCNFTDNHGFFGGAMAYEVGTVVIERVYAQGNTGNAETGAGGALVLFATNATISESTFYNNTVGEIGGSFMFYESTTDMSGCVVEKNSALIHGGGIGFALAFGVISDTTIQGNLAKTAGGGIAMLSASVVTLVRCLIMDNIGFIGGGGVYVVGYDAKVVIQSSQILRNIVYQTGGGVLISGGEVSMYHSLVESNSAISATFNMTSTNTNCVSQREAASIQGTSLFPMKITSIACLRRKR